MLTYQTARDIPQMELPLGGSVTPDVKGVMSMVTYNMMFLYTMVIIAVITLCYTLFNKDDE